MLVAGGYGSGGAFSSAELHDLATGAWTATGPLTTAREQHTATLLPDGKVLVAGGRGTNNNPLSSTELYDPATGTWSLTGNLNTGRDGHTATLLQSGKVLVAEGAEVQANQGIVVLEAMKMQNEIKSPKKGTVRKLGVKDGAPVNSGDFLATVE